MLKTCEKDKARPGAIQTAGRVAPSTAWVRIRPLIVVALISANCAGFVCPFVEISLQMLFMLPDPARASRSEITAHRPWYGRGARFSTCAVTASLKPTVRWSFNENALPRAAQHRNHRVVVLVKTERD